MSVEFFIIAIQNFWADFNIVNRYNLCFVFISC